MHWPREATPYSQRMKIISIKQPWASLIASGAKDVENRTWSTRYRGPVLIHASQRADNVTSEEIEQRCGVRPPAVLPLGGIVGLAEIVDCKKPHASPWYNRDDYLDRHGARRDYFAFVLANSRPLPFVQWKGQPLPVRRTTSPPSLANAPAPRTPSPSPPACFPSWRGDSRSIECSDQPSGRP